jgi:hypothetical protein
MLISPSYRELNSELHQREDIYGAFLDKWTVSVIGKGSILDYGCGKGELKRSMKGRDVREYDPAIPELAGDPEAADNVVCRCVLEHVEPDCLDNVLDHIRLLTRKRVIIKVTTIPSSHTLADGRNAHLIIEHANWWMGKFLARWPLIYAERMQKGLRFIGEV